MADFDSLVPNTPESGGGTGLDFDSLVPVSSGQEEQESGQFGLQFASGVADSTASLAGFPVDAMTAVLNLGINGLNQLGTNIPEITNPVGGSQDLRTNQTVNALANPVGIDFGNPQENIPDPQGFGENVANIVGRAVPAIATGAAAFRSLPQSQGVAGSAAQGAGVGSIEGGILSESDTLEGQIRDIGFGSAGGFVGGLAAPLVRGLSRGNDADKQVAELISNGSLDNRIVGRQIDQSGNLVKRPQDIAAQTQGFGDGVITLTRVANPQTKAKFGEIVNVVTDQQRNIINERTLRPTDVVGRSIVDRFVSVDRINREAGRRLNNVAKSLQDESVDISQAVNNFSRNLSERLNVNLAPDEAGNISAIFRGSDIEGRVNSDLQDSLNIVIERARDTSSSTAFDAHRLKQSLDRLIDFDNVNQGLQGNVESIITSFRRDIDQILDSNFPEYAQVNDVFSETRQATNAFRRIVGRNVDLSSEGIESRVGTLSRRIFSNAQSRVDIQNAAQQLTDVANRNGADFQDDIVQQAIFASEIEDVFKIAPANSFRGEVARGAAQAVTGDRRSGVERVVRAGVDAARGVNPRNQILAIRELLK